MAVKDISRYPPNWSAISFEFKRRNHFACYCCHRNSLDTPGLIINVHHKDFNPQNNDPSNFIVLCRDCHIRLHGILHQAYQRLKDYYIAVSRGQIPLALPDEYKPPTIEGAITLIQQYWLEAKTE